MRELCVARAVIRGWAHYLSSLVLGNLVLLVLVAVLGLAVRPAGFRNVDLVARNH